MHKQSYLFFIFLLLLNTAFAQDSWIRINQLGYKPNGIKVAVWCTKSEKLDNKKWQLIDDQSGKAVYSATTGKSSGTYGPFSETVRLNFSSFIKPGKYYLKAGKAKSPVFEIGEDVYKGSADFCLRYMRQQRSKYNPTIKDSCHTSDGYTLYGPMPDSSFINVAGGWHDATDYLQYVTTSANATYQMLAAYRDFPGVFNDGYAANGLEGANKIPDILDEVRWGLDWLLKMHPKDDWMFNQVGDDRDHVGFRLPQNERLYGRGYERPVYFVSGEPQIRGKYMNTTKGTSSTAGKFSSAFSLGAEIYGRQDASFASLLSQKAITAFAYGLKKPGYTQTASVKAPYIYGEENWMDDMELAGAMLKDNSKLNYAFELAQKEPVTQWFIDDTAAHYQWYPFINAGHYELSKKISGKEKQALINFYKQGIEIIWKRAEQNAFYRGIPFIWCSNNFTTAFAIQCYWYRQMSGDDTYASLEQANFDWLFGCNPWGTSMVYGLPSRGDTPVDPHASLLKIGKYPTDGGLVDGPVKGSIFNNLIGITLYDADEYAEFQSDLAVYHDDAGDFSTNEPTMDGTATLIYLLAAKEAEGSKKKVATKPVNAKPPVVANAFTYDHGAVIKGDSTQKKIALVFTGDEFADGGFYIADVLKQENVSASFFLTGNFYRNPAFKNMIRTLKSNGHYLGPHSDKHILYCDWTKRDSLLVTQEIFANDLGQNYEAMSSFGIKPTDAYYFMPPYEWYNDSIAVWTNHFGSQLINFTTGTLSNADYTTPEMKNYRSSDTIFQSILRYEQTHVSGLNGFILLLHIGTDSKRTDKMYYRLPELISYLKRKKYALVTIEGLLNL
ncbi:cellulase [Terrimonas sp.]|uniref:glycoside hydrolase family 9 protein n=1 Tax=Terrimonas sp. TaxID=1914338 RepID=UPI000D5247F4|nr:glycoside hydrolase family 9 protein [Terrimonas sp.]PVD51141.1 cellulase [Terrimonas sp.]